MLLIQRYVAQTERFEWRHQPNASCIAELKRTALMQGFFRHDQMVLLIVTISSLQVPGLLRLYVSEIPYYLSRKLSS